jgi:hypothetical protein
MAYSTKRRSRWGGVRRYAVKKLVERCPIDRAQLDQMVREPTALLDLPLHGGMEIGAACQVGGYQNIGGSHHEVCDFGQAGSGFASRSLLQAEQHCAPTRAVL